MSVEPRHAQLQARLIDLRERGVLIALCSRNEEADVWAAFERASGMLLSREHVSTFRIAPTLAKGAAVRALCVELRCAAEHVLFVDDNPAEVAAVRAALPPPRAGSSRRRTPSEGAAAARLAPRGAARRTERRGRRARSLAAARAGAASLRRVAPSRAEYHAALGVRIDVSSSPTPTLLSRAPPPAARAHQPVQYVEAAAATAGGACGGGGRRRPRRRPIRRLRARGASARDGGCSTPLVLHVVPVLGRGVEHAICARSATSPTPRRRRWRWAHAQRRGMRRC